ncbi:MAG: HlyC/CorC family transporter [Candidatus Andersenbacteria bacterium]|nr:HlyC/CorC family transporter [Candidatus Andersenbacteria bacterium]
MGLVIVIILLSISAIFSGLTLGFFSLNKKDLERKANLGNKQAQKVYNLRKNGNLLLCTLLIGNVAVNATLSIFLGSIASGLIAGIAATSLIVIFGEIVPQAIFSRHALKLGAKLTWLVRIFIFLFYPISRPIAWALDRGLGKEMPTIYSKHELIKIIEDHEDSEESDIDIDEEKILKGALSYSSKTVNDILTPRTEIFALPFDQKLTKKNIEKIFEKGHSRIPVYKKDLDNIVGILYAKDLLLNNYKNKSVKDIARDKVIFVDIDKPLDDLLNAFKTTKNHLFVAVDKNGVVSGIVTIEDVIEEIIGSEIVDEYDQHADLRKVAEDKIKKKKLQKI